MYETPYKENPDFPAPDTVVSDKALAEHMAQVADPGYEELIRGGRNLSINQAVAISIKIGESMESARRDHLAQTAASEALGTTVATSEIPIVPESSVYGPAEIRQKNLEQNLEIFRNTISDIFTTIRYAEGYPKPVERDIHQGLKRTEEVTLYDPASRTINVISQTIVYKGNSAHLEEQWAEELKPVDDTNTEGSLIKKVKAEGRLLIPGHAVRIGEKGEIVEHKYEDSFLAGDLTPEAIIQWSQRLASSFPLKDPLLVKKSIYDTSDRMSIEPREVLIEKGKGAHIIPELASNVRAHHREPILTRDLKKALAAEQKRFKELKKPPAA